MQGDAVIGEADGELIVAEDCIGVGGCGCPMLAKIWRLFVAMRPVAKSPPYSASATKEQTTGIRVECVEMGWLRGESSGWSPR
jgi:hypothetical protein